MSDSSELIEGGTCQTSLMELVRGVPKDLRGEWEIQWFEDGTPSGHAMAPVGKYLHEQADEIERLQLALTDCESEWANDRMDQLAENNKYAQIVRDFASEQNKFLKNEIAHLERIAELEALLKYGRRPGKSNLPYVQRIAELETAIRRALKRKGSSHPNALAAVNILERALKKADE